MERNEYTLTEALTGKPLPENRARIAASIYDVLSALCVEAQEKEVTPSASLTIKHLIALTGSYLVSNKGLRVAQAQEIAKAAGYIVEALDTHLNKAAGEALNNYIK